MKKVFYKNSVIFVLGDILNKAIPFLMLPILTRYLTPEGYGNVVMFTVMVSVLAVFTGLSVHGAININYFKLKKDELRVYISNVMMILLGSTFVVYLLLFIFSSALIQRLHLDIGWFIVAVLLASSQFLTIINLGLWMIEEKAKFYSLYQIGQTIVVTLLSIIFVVGLEMGWQGELLAIALGTIVFSMISLYLIFKRGYLKWSYNKIYMEDALKFGVPLIPHTLSNWIKTGADRIILMSVLGSGVVGIYSVAYQIGMVISVLVVAFNKAWIPYLFKVLSTEPTWKEKQKMVKFTYLYFIVIFCIAIIFSYIADIVIPYFVGEKFLEVSEYIIYFALAFAFQGMYFMIGNYIFYVKKTQILSYISMFTAAIHLILLYSLLDIYGLMGVAYTSCISSFVTFVLVWYYSAQVYDMPWNILKRESV